MSTPLDDLVPILDEPLRADDGGADEAALPYEKTLAEARALQERPRIAGGYRNISRQHRKNRMTVWERIGVLSEERPMVLFQNWGPSLDGASLVTAIVKIHGRDVAVYGHDFTVRAGSMDATNGRKLASLYKLAAKQGMPVIGLNDSAGAFVPAGVGGLDGYAEAFTALRRISGIVPSVMCMFGFNAGGGSYLPRQGSFLIQPDDTFFGLTGVGVVKEVLGEDVTPDELGGPAGTRRVGRRGLHGRGRGRRAQARRAPADVPAGQQPLQRALRRDERPGRARHREPGRPLPCDVQLPDGLQYPLRHPARHPGGL